MGQAGAVIGWDVPWAFFGTDRSGGRQQRVIKPIWEMDAPVLAGSLLGFAKMVSNVSLNA
jgi:hypothetical protein